jgi:hypothetical protein
MTMQPAPTTASPLRRSARACHALFAIAMSRVFLAVATLALIAAPAFAQTDRPVELSAAYLNVGGTMHGWSAQVSKDLTTRLAVLFEVDRSRGADCGGCEPVYRDLGILGGVRYTWRRESKFTPSWQILGGVLHSKSEPYYADLIFGPPYYEESETVEYLAIQPGVGFTVMMTPRVGLRMQTDLQFAVPDQSEYEGMTVFPRVTIGAVFRLGRGR